VIGEVDVEPHVFLASALVGHKANNF
jgi:hypothetical protein